MAVNVRLAGGVGDERPIQVMHVIAGLESGGAEMSLSKLVTQMDRTQFTNSVVSLTDEGPILGARIRAQGIPVHALGHGRGAANPKIVPGLAALMRRTKPDLIQTWMYHADLCGVLSARLAGGPPVIWGTHNTLMDPRQTKRLTRAVIGLCTRMSRRGPSAILCSSEAARSFHEDLGYPAAKLRVIESGIDTEEFVPDPAARVTVRSALGLLPDVPMVGLSARFHPQKDHPNFFQAAGILHRMLPNVHFALWGAGVTPDNPVLCRCAEEAGVAGVTHLLGLRNDTACLTSAMDAVALSSAFGESFGLVLGEAMACGVPAVTTDQPGPVSVLGGLGWIVPVKDPAALAEAWRTMLTLSPQARADWGLRARRSILDRLSLHKTVSMYERFYIGMARSGGLREKVLA